MVEPVAFLYPQIFETTLDNPFLKRLNWANVTDDPEGFLAVPTTVCVSH